MGYRPGHPEFGPDPDTYAAIVYDALEGCSDRDIEDAEAWLQELLRAEDY
jgi:hypothetical protein